MSELGGVSLLLDVGCGFHTTHKKRSGVGLDLQRGKCDVVGDCEKLPFQSGCFSFVYARNVLEHMNNPLKGLAEISRVLKPQGKLSVTIPIYPNNSLDELRNFILGFPLQSLTTVKRLLHWRKYGHLKGFLHVNRVQPRHIAQFFTVILLTKISPVHTWFRGTKGRVLNRLGLKTFYSLPNVYYVYAVKS